MVELGNEALALGAPDKLQDLYVKDVVGTHAHIIRT